MRRSLSPALSLCLLLLLAAGPLRAQAEKKIEKKAEEVTFRFAPPHGTTCVQTVVTTKATEVGGKKQTEVARSKARLRFDKSADGYTLTATPVSASVERDGQAVQNPVLDVLNGLVLTYRIDAEGNLVSVQGYEDVMERFRKALPPEAVQAVSQVISADLLVAKEKAEWAGRIGDFVGATLELGSSWTAEAPFALPTGEQVQFYTRTELAEKVKCGERDCVRIRFRYDSDASAVGAKVEQMVKDIAKGAGGENPGLQLGKMTITGGGERVLDPATMLVYSETMERTLRMESAQGPVIRTEKKEYSFEY